MARVRDLIQRAVLGGNLNQLVRLGRIGLTWKGNDLTRQSLARCALDRFGQEALPALVRCGLLDKNAAQQLRWDDFDPLCAALLQPITPQRAMLLLSSTKVNPGAANTRRMGEVGVRVVQAACRFFQEYPDESQEGRDAWLSIIDRLDRMGMTRSARLSYAPVSMLGVCDDAMLAQGLLERGFNPSGVPGTIPPLSLCTDPEVALLLMRNGASSRVPAMEFTDDAIQRGGYTHQEEMRVFSRWCRLDVGVAMDIISRSDMAREKNEDFRDILRDMVSSIHENSRALENGAARELFTAWCRKAGHEIVERVLGGQDALLRRTIMLNKTLSEAYSVFLAQHARACMEADTPTIASHTPMSRL